MLALSQDEKVYPNVQTVEVKHIKQSSKKKQEKKAKSGQKFTTVSPVVATIQLSKDQAKDLDQYISDKSFKSFIPKKNIRNRLFDLSSRDQNPFFKKTYYDTSF